MAVDLSTLVRLQPSQAKSAGEMLARAFYDDSLSSYLLPDSSQRMDKLTRLFSFLVRLGIYYGEVYATSPDLEGVIIWFSPETRLTLRGVIRDGGLRILASFGMKSIMRYLPLYQLVTSMHKRQAPFPQWYLSLVGVVPELQGMGYGGRLLRPMFARLDARHLACYLETETDSNVSFYRHFGFEVAETAVIPGTGLTIWAMLREANGWDEETQENTATALGNCASDASF
jgi:ribosomal protein S18 acetylase RimI-like enzyme